MSRFVRASHGSSNKVFKEFDKAYIFFETLLLETFASCQKLKWGIIMIKRSNDHSRHIVKCSVID